MLIMGGTWTSLTYIITHPLLFRRLWQLPPLPELSRDRGSSSAESKHEIIRSGESLSDVDDEYMFLGLRSLTPELKKHLSLRDLHLLEALKMTNGSLPSAISSPRHSNLYRDSSDIDVSITYLRESSSRCSSDGIDDRDLSDFFSGNRVSLRLQLLKSTIKTASTDDEKRAPLAPLCSSLLLPDSRERSNRPTLSSEAYEEAPPPFVTNDRLSLSSLQTEEILDPPQEVTEGQW